MPPQAPTTPQPRMDINNGKFELMKDIGSGNFGVAKLMRDRQSGELLAVKCVLGLPATNACQMACDWLGLCRASLALSGSGRGAAAC